MARVGGVFINYRAVDDPLGAAAIHAILASEFGEDQVFRDCESMKPGEHYPSALREALERFYADMARLTDRIVELVPTMVIPLLFARPPNWTGAMAHRAPCCGPSTASCRSWGVSASSPTCGVGRRSRPSWQPDWSRVRPARAGPGWR